MFPADFVLKLCAFLRHFELLQQTSLFTSLIIGIYSMQVLKHKRAINVEFQGDLEPFLELQPTRSPLPEASVPTQSQGLKINGIFKHFREVVHAWSQLEVICEVKQYTGVKRRMCVNVGGKCFRVFVTLCIKNRRWGLFLKVHFSKTDSNVCFFVVVVKGQTGDRWK